MSASSGSHLQHHFESPEQQFSAGKLGMWIFLATEVLLFGGLFCAYVVIRVHHPEAFVWAHGLLDRNLGALNTAILLVSSATMAGAVRCAQLSRRRGLVLMLGLTLLGGAGFMAVKSIEYRGKFEHGLLWGVRFQPDRAYLASHFGGEAPAPKEALAPKLATTGNAEQGKKIFLGTCASCHGVTGEGIKGQGAKLAGSEFIRQHDAPGLLAFVKKGRQPFDADSIMHLSMPARGGNPALNDQSLLDVVTFVKSLTVPESTPVVIAGDTIAAAAPSGDTPRLIDGEWWVPRSAIAPAAVGPKGLRVVVPARIPHASPTPPSGAQLFFSLYFLMTGLHGIHVLAGMGLITYLLVRGWRGHFGAVYFTPVDLGGLYWHVVDVIWIFLFPLFYLVA